MRFGRRGLVTVAAALVALGAAALLAPRPRTAGPSQGEEGPAGVLFRPDAGPAAVAEVSAGVPLPSGIAGIVVDGQGGPIAGAEVAMARNGDRAPARATTGEDGRFAFTRVAADGDHLVGARAPGRAPALLGSVRAGTMDLRIVLLPPIRVEGRVTDLEGTPCPGARVRVTLRFEGVQGDLGGFEVRADESGEYAFPALPRVEGSVQAHYKDATSPAARLEPPGAKDALRADLRVETGPCLAGIVLGDDGTPLPMARISARRVADGKETFAAAEDDGRFEIRGLTPVPHEIAVGGPTREWLDLQSVRATPTDRSLEFRLKRDPDGPGRAVFRVADGEGQAVKGVRMMVFLEGTVEPVAATSLTAGPDGLFRTNVLDAGTYRIVVRGNRGSGSTAPFAVKAAATADAGTIRLAAPVTVRGRILGPDGAPAVRARIVPDAGGIPEDRAVREDGTFEIRGLPEGPGRLRASLAGCRELTATWEATGWTTQDLGDLRFTAATGVVHGTVRRRGGGAVPGARVSLSPPSNRFLEIDGREVTADAQGRYEVTRVAVGDWSLSARPPKKDERDEEPPALVTERDVERFSLGEGERREIHIDID